MNPTFQRPILSVRIHAGLNAGVFLAGLLALTGTQFMSPDELLKSKFPLLNASLDLVPTSVNHIAGVSALIRCPHEHVHRTPADIQRLYDNSALSEPARRLASDIWSVLTRAEAKVHDKPIEQVHFHEVGRMANVIAIGLIAELVTALNPSRIVASAIPLGDGLIHCAHGAMPYPAPAMFEMLDGVPVRPYRGEGEPVTPTGLAVLLGLKTQFGSWPKMRVQKHVTAFLPNKVFHDVPNGCLFVLGSDFDDEAPAR